MNDLLLHASIPIWFVRFFAPVAIGQQILLIIDRRIFRRPDYLGDICGLLTIVIMTFGAYLAWAFGI